MTIHTPWEQMGNIYNIVHPKFDPRFDFRTNLPKEIAITRTVAVTLFAGYLSYKAKRPLFSWTIIVLGLAFAGATIYQNLYAKDPMIEAFQHVVGGKEKFNKLPILSLTQAPNEKLYQALQKLRWNELQAPISKAKTKDGRTIVIVKGSSKKAKTKQILCFVEKVSPYDTPREIAHEHEAVCSFRYAVLSPFMSNIFSANLPLLNNENADKIKMCCKLKSMMANELHAQIT